MENIEQVIYYFFQFTNNVRVYHWNTTSYARHKATDNFLGEFQPLFDSLIENYMGKYDRPNFKKFRIHVSPWDDESAVNNFKELRQLLISMQSIIENDTDLQNTRDEMLSLTNTTLYLFSLN